MSIAATSTEERFAQATQLQLTWWRFRRHKLAVASLIVVGLFYLVVVFADFLAVADPHATDARRSFIPPNRSGLGWPLPIRGRLGPGPGQAARVRCVWRRLRFAASRWPSH